MTFQLFGYEITIRRINDPLRSLRTADVDRLARTFSGYEHAGISRTITRIKAVRALRPGTSLKDAKDWVDTRSFGDR